MINNNCKGSHTKSVMQWAAYYFLVSNEPTSCEIMVVSVPHRTEKINYQIVQAHETFLSVFGNYWEAFSNVIAKIPKNTYYKKYILD